MLTADERVARERKQKIFVAVGGVLLLALLAFQLPKLLGGGSSASPTTPPQTVAGPVSPTTPKVSTPAPIALVNTDRPLAPDRGQLSSFSEFSGNDPFVQQVSFSDAPAASKGEDGKGKKEGGAKASSKGFTVGGAPAASATVISVNGARQALVPGAAFPASDPMFVLVSERQSSKSVTIGVAGGEYAGGARTTTLSLGKPLVLTNTTTGARYKLVLVAVGNGKASATTEKSSSGTSDRPGSAP
jgi:hypothetical protein